MLWDYDALYSYLPLSKQTSPEHMACVSMGTSGSRRLGCYGNQSYLMRFPSRVLGG